MSSGRRGFGAALATSMLSAFAFAQTPTAPSSVAEPANAWLEAIRAQHHVVALGAAKLVGNELVELAVAGHRRNGDATLVTVDDCWHLGSCTKAMTATLCAMLIDEGRLRLDTTVPELFPDLAEQLHEDWREVTLRELLSHRSGLAANPTVDGLWRKMAEDEGPPRAMRSEVALELLSRARSSARGGFVYSNAGYMLAGAALERLTDRAWEDLIRERLFVPLGMTSAGFGAPGTADAATEPFGHVGPRATPIPPGRGADNPPSLGPAGTVHASLRDWSKFIALQLGTDGLDPPLVRAETLASMREASAGEEYRCGFLVTKRPWAKGPVLTHNGSNLKWFCVVWLAPDDDLAVMAVCNEAGESAQKATDAACAAMLSRRAKGRERP